MRQSIQTATFVAAILLSLAAAAADPVTVTLNATNNSNITGTATLTPEGNQTNVVVKLQGAPADAVEPVHFHKGNCAQLDPKPVYPLQDIKNGTSTTVVPVEISKLVATPHTINVHKSAADMKTSVACGEVKG